jgi:hypothetical protein
MKRQGLHAASRQRTHRDASPDAAWRPGLRRGLAVGGAGGYREGARDEVLALGTTVWRNGEFYTLGATPAPLFSCELPQRYAVEMSGHDWTGKTVTYRWKGGSTRVELRTTLPGPLFIAKGKSLRIRWASGNESQTVTGLESGRTWSVAGVPDPRGERLFLLSNPVLPTLVVSSVPISRITIISHMHWEVVFARAGGTLLLVPLLDVADAPRTKTLRTLWKQLCERPPLSCIEHFRFQGGNLHLRQTFPHANLAPLPPFAELTPRSSGLWKPPSSTTLCRTLIGPYAVVAGDEWHGRISMRWARAAAVPSRPISGRLEELPDELVYAGDASWEPETPMDQLLTLRVWASLAHHVTGRHGQELRRALQVPTAAAFRKSLATITEPITGRTWAKEALLFDHSGDVSYDADWYNGLTLSGIARAAGSADQVLSQQAISLSRAVRTERASMMEYFSLFHEWALGMAWTDARGWLIDLDCVHNGMEGLLAQAGLCKRDHDDRGHDWALYLAGKTALAQIAAFELAPWRAACTPSYVVPTGADQDSMVSAFCTWKTLKAQSADDKRHHLLSNHFPEHAALVLLHGPVARLKNLARTWSRRHGERYSDWIGFFLGSGWRKHRKGTNQEARIQAAAFYHLAPEVSLRLWVLGEEPDHIEKRYKTPLNLAEQIHLRLATRLEIDGRPLRRSP